MIRRAVRLAVRLDLPGQSHVSAALRNGHEVIDIEKVEDVEIL